MLSVLKLRGPKIQFLSVDLHDPTGQMVDGRWSDITHVLALDVAPGQHPGMLSSKNHS